jgi:diaminopimelate epimerase
MKIPFHKYQGTGNDFIMIDNLDGAYSFIDIEQVKMLCDRRFGIGADGLILINSCASFDFEMDYFNSDGTKSFCGNGARCAVQFYLNVSGSKEKFHFLAIDGEHTAALIGQEISLEMSPVNTIHKLDADYIVNTGSPHYIQRVDNLNAMDVYSSGRSIRNSDRFIKEGINVNFVDRLAEAHLAIRTYERGVENETLSCGTGATACALVEGLNLGFGAHTVRVDVLGGQLNVSFTRTENETFSNIRLQGPATFVFQGEIDV